MKHLKRQKVPKSWPIPRKGTTFVVKPRENLNKGIPILIILRDILRIAKNRKEVKKIIHEKSVLLNGKIVKDEKNSATLFDVITINSLKKNYRLDLSEKGKFKLEEIKETEAGQKVSKIINKKMLKKKRMQLNLIDGRNFLSDIKCKTNDSVIIDLKNKKIEKCLPLQEKANAIVFGGKHAGARGKIDKIDTKHQIAKLDAGKEKINVLIKHLMVVE